MSEHCKNGHPLEGENLYERVVKTKTKPPRIRKECRTCIREKGTVSNRKLRGIALPPDTETVMDNYKEPLTEIEYGHGYYGTVVYDKSREYIQCHICGYLFKTLGHHIATIHKMNDREYKVEFGLPTGLSLRAPNNTNHINHWLSLSDEERQKRLANMAEGRKKANNNRKGHRREALYYKNLEGRCPDQLMDKIQMLAKELGDTPTRKQFIAKYGANYSRSITYTFGSWSEALRLVGMTSKLYGGRNVDNKYTDEMLLEMLVNFKARYGREPVHSDTTHANELVSSITYARRFGSWLNAKKIAYKHSKQY